jgi:hypothetical protein
MRSLIGERALGVAFTFFILVATASIIFNAQSIENAHRIDRIERPPNKLIIKGVIHSLDVCSRDPTCAHRVHVSLSKFR